VEARLLWRWDVTCKNVLNVHVPLSLMLALLNSTRRKAMDGERIELQELEFDQPLEEDINHVDVPTSERRVYADQGDPEIESLYGKYKRGKLIVQPDFQRYFVWDAKKSSRLIESALLDIPLPVIYLSEEKDGKEYVIDGQQRLTSFFSFMDGKLPYETKDFLFAYFDDKFLKLT
jgi:hypothetical protein